MADMLQSAAEWLGRMFQQHASQPVVYRYDGQAIEVTATIGRTVHEVTDAYGITAQVETRDYLIPAEQLEITPQAGNQIRETLADRVEVYEVMHPVAGKEPWRWSDPHRIMRRIHTSHVATEPLS